MNSQWHKLGLLYCPSENNRHPKLLTHAANPVPILLEGDVYRVFYSGRDKEKRSSVGSVDIDIVRQEIIYEHAAPFFEHGPVDSFYSDGVSIGNFYTVGNTTYLLFMGWQNPAHQHWFGSIGRLILHSDGHLSLDSDTAFLPMSNVDPISLSYPWVIYSQGQYHMWYGSTVTWDAGNQEMLHVINYASSEDGHHWTRQGVSVPYEIGVAQAFSRPSILQEQDGLTMWFSYRDGTGKPYRIGMAKSQNYQDWVLHLEQVGIDVSATGWDANMIEYPFVLTHKGYKYMFYNGDGYGRSGFGLAKQDL